MASAGSSQTSFLHPLEISYGSEVGASIYGGMSWSFRAASTLQVSFSVSAPVAYSLMCEGTGDPLACTDNWNLNSANQGVLASGPTVFQIMSEWGVPIYYSGIFNPGDIYTLSLSNQGESPIPVQSGGDGGGLVVDMLVVPEPGSMALGGLCLTLLVLARARHCRSEEG
jgi:hypothetical protein